MMNIRMFAVVAALSCLCASSHAADEPAGAPNELVAAITALSTDDLGGVRAVVKEQAADIMREVGLGGFVNWDMEKLILGLGDNLNQAKRVLVLTAVLLVIIAEVVLRYFSPSYEVSDAARLVEALGGLAYFGCTSCALSKTRQSFVALLAGRLCTLLRVWVAIDSDKRRQASDWLRATLNKLARREASWAPIKAEAGVGRRARRRRSPALQALSRLAHALGDDSQLTCSAMTEVCKIHNVAAVMRDAIRALGCTSSGDRRTALEGCRTVVNMSDLMSTSAMLVSALDAAIAFEN